MSLQEALQAADEQTREKVREGKLVFYRGQFMPPQDRVLLLIQARNLENLTLFGL